MTGYYNDKLSAKRLKRCYEIAPPLCLLTKESNTLNIQCLCVKAILLMCEQRYRRMKQRHDCKPDENMNKIIKDIQPFDFSSYDTIDLDRLVIYTAVELHKLGIELSLENIIVGAFKLFPKKFSLVGFPEFPDSTRVEKCLWRCKGNARQWIGGKTRHGYLITDRSKAIAAETQSQISKPGYRKQKISSRTRRKESILNEVTNSPAYSEYLNGKGESISEADFCYLLQGTLDSSRETLRENFLSLKMFAKELEHKDVLKLLSFLEGRFKKFLGGALG